MALNFGPVVAGPYTATWNAVDVGFTVDGYRLQTRFMQQLINKTDLYGDTLIDGIYRGADMSITYKSRVYSAGSIGPACPFGGLGVISSTALPIGSNMRTLAEAWVMTSVANTSAEDTPATLTAGKTFLAANSNIELLFDSSARDVPVTLQALPYESATVAGTMIHASLT